jgi:hypothetical protein
MIVFLYIPDALSSPESVSGLADIKRAEQGVFFVLVCAVVPSEAPLFSQPRGH